MGSKRGTSFDRGRGWRDFAVRKRCRRARRLRGNGPVRKGG